MKVEIVVDKDMKTILVLGTAESKARTDLQGTSGAKELQILWGFNLLCMRFVVG